MIIFPSLLVRPAKEAGIRVPEDVTIFDRDAYPHFAVFCSMQLGRPMPWSSAHWENAKIIGALSEEEVRRVTPNELYEKGFA